MTGVTVTTAVILPLAAIFAFYGLTAACSVATRAALATSILVGPICLAVWVGAEIYAWPAATFFRIISFVNPAIYLAAAIAKIERTAHPATISPATGGDLYARLPVGADSAMLVGIALVALVIAALLWKRAEV
jgi:hypothetical protein